MSSLIIISAFCVSSQGIRTAVPVLASPSLILTILSSLRLGGTTPIKNITAGFRSLPLGRYKSADAISPFDVLNEICCLEGAFDIHSSGRTGKLGIICVTKRVVFVATLPIGVEVTKNIITKSVMRVIFPIILILVMLVFDLIFL